MQVGHVIHFSVAVGENVTLFYSLLQSVFLSRHFFASKLD